MEVYKGDLSESFDDNIVLFDKILRPDENFDMLRKTMQISDARIVMYYIDGFIKAETLQKLLTYVVTVKDFGHGKKGDALSFAEKSITSAEVGVTSSVDELVLAVMSGCTLFFCDKFSAEALVIDLRTYPAREADEPENDKVMRGSRDGFVETLISNISMIRRRIRSPDQP